MPSDVLITPASSKVEFTDGSNATKTLRITGTSFSFDSDLGIGITSPTSKLNVLSTTSLSSVFKAEGVNGTLFEVTDDLSNSLMSVNTIGGLPVFEVFANNTIIAGQYSANDFVINGNKVGIGLASPSYKLQVSGSSGDQAKIGDIIFGSTVAGSNSITAATSFGSNGNLVINASGQTNQLWLISSSGNVGFGTFSPANKIAVIGSASVGSNYNTAAPTNGLIVEGSVGIGTTSPTQKLHLNNGVLRISGGGNDSTGEINLDNGTQYSGNSFQIRKESSAYWGIKSVASGNDLALFVDNNVNLGLYIKNGTGNIGINNTSPSAKLDIRQTSANTGLKVFTNDTGSAYIAQFIGYDNVLGDTTRMVVQAGGNVGIGTTTIGSRFVVNGGTVNTTTYTTSEARISDASLHLMKTVAGGIFESIRAMNADTTAGTTVRFIAASTSDPFNNTNGGKVFIDAIRTSTNMDLAFSLNDVAGAAPVERVRFMGSGSVGIGTVSPSRKLEVLNTANSPTYIRINNQDSGTSAYTGIDLQSYGGGWQVRVPASTTFVNPLQFSFNDVEKVRIQSDGNVGIGTTTPAALLNIHGAYPQVIINNPTAGNGVQILLRDNGTAAGFIGHYDSTTKLQFSSTNASVAHMTINNAGNIGIGITNPTQLLEVYKSFNGDIVSQVTNPNTGTSATAQFFASNGTTKTQFFHTGTAFVGSGVTNYTGLGGIYNVSTGISLAAGGASGVILFGTGSNQPERMRITSAGLVGIGTTNPTARLDVAGGGLSVSGWSNNNSGSAGGVEIGFDGNWGIFQVYDRVNAFYRPILINGSYTMFYVSGAEKARLNTSGNFGIGFTSTINNKLAVQGSASIGSNFNIAAPTNGLIVEGSVGIGATIPNCKLDVRGEMQVASSSAYTTHFNYNDVGANFITTANGGTTYFRGSSNNITSMTVDGSGTVTTNYNTILAAINGNVGIGLSSPLAKLHVNSTTSGATLIRADGTNGTLFSVVDDLSDSLMSVNNSAGLPVLEVFADDRVVMGQYGQNDFVLVNNKLGLGTNNPAYKLDINGTLNVSGNTSLSTISITGTITSSATEAIRINNNNGFVSFYNTAGSSRTGYLQGNTGNSVLLASENNALLQFAVGGTVRATISTSGDVGIGTTAPTSQSNYRFLQVNGTNSAVIETMVGNTRIGGFDSDSSNLYVGTIGAFPIVFRTSVNEKWRITNAGVFQSNGAQTIQTSTGNLTLATAAGNGHILLTPHGTGNVGIGTNTPTALLDLYSSASRIKFRRGASYDMSFGMHDSTNSALSIKNASDASTLVYFQYDGIVGIGTTSFTYASANRQLVELYGASESLIALRNPTGNLYIQKTSSDVYINNTNSGIMSFATSNAQRMIIMASGSVSFNSGSDILSQPANIFLNGNTGTGTGPALAFGQSDSVTGSIGHRARIIGSGTSQDIFIQSQGTSNNVGINANPANAYIYFQTQGTDKVRIQADGNVGIGNTSPAYKLDVSGTINTSNFMLVSYPYGNAFPLQLNASSFLKANDYYYGMTINSGDVNYISGKFLINGGTYKRVELYGYENGIGYIPTVIPGGNVGIGTTNPAFKLDVNSSIVSRSTLSSPRFSSAGTYVYGVTNSPTWNQSCGTAVNNNATAPDGTTTAGTYTLNSTCGSYDMFQTITGLTVGRVYTIGMWVKLGTATNFCLVVNNTAAWNTIGGKAFTSSDGLSTGKWTHISYTFSQPGGSNQINLHLGYHAETGVAQQTAGTVFIWNIEMTEFSSTWIGNVEDEIRLPGSSIWTSRGNVGIGTVTPTGTYGKLAVAGGIRTLDDNNSKLELGRYSSGASNSYIKLGSNSNSLRITNNTDAADIFTIENNGNVGIGTTNPTNRLHIYSSANEPVLIQGTTGGTWLNFQSSTSNLWSIGAINAAGFGVYNRTTNAYTLYVANNGNIGIGNINTSNNKLHVDGSMSVGSGYNTAAPTNGLIVQGNVGISKTTIRLNSVLDVNGSGCFGTSGYGFYIGTDGTGTFLDAGTQLIRMFAGQVERMRIATDGNIGIGTVAPTSKLNVLSSTSLSSVFKAEGINGTLFEVTDDLSNSLMSVNTIGGLPVFEVFANNTIIAGQYGANDLVINGNKVGVGTANPSFKLDVNGTLGVNAGTSDGNWPFIVVDSSSAGGTNRYALNKIGAMGFNNADNYAQLQLVGSSGAYVDFCNASTDDLDARIIYYSNSRFDIQYGTVMTINSTGVGIATTTPYTRAHVYGTLTVDAAGAAVNSFTEGIRLGAATNGYSIVTFGANAAASSGQITNQWWIGKHGSDNSFNFNSQGGGDVFRILQNGNVGIGNTNPGYKLYVNGTSYFNGALQVNSNITLSGGGDVIINDSDGTGFFASYMDAGVAYMRVDDGGTANGSLYINSKFFVGPSTGNVGVGTVTPASLFHVSKAGNSAGGTILMGVANDNTTKWSYLVSTQYNSSTYPQGFSVIGGLTDSTSNKVVIGGSIYEANPATEIQFYTHTAVSHNTGGSLRMVINTNGNVGIGAASPADKLDVNGNLYFSKSADPLIYAGSGIGLNIDGQALYLNRYTNANIAMVIGGGNVGVGTTNPLNKLHIVQSIPTGTTSTPTNTTLRLDSNSNNYLSFVNTVDNQTYAGLTFTDNNLGGYIVFRNYTGNVLNGSDSMVYGAYQDHIFQSTVTAINTGSEVMRIKGNGNVGIGSNAPNNKLHVNGSTSIGSGYNTAAPTDGLIVQGNVGIGVTSPSNTKLHVVADWVGGHSTVKIQTITSFASGGTTGIGLYDSNGTRSGYLYSYSAGTSVGSSIANPLIFETNGTEKMRILSGGNVGIGITAPSATLHVNSTTSGATLLRADGTNGTLFSVVDDLSDSLMSVNNSAGLPVLEVFADDRVVAGQYGANDFVLVNNKLGLGTNNPQYELDIVGPGTGGSVNIISRIRSTASSNIFDTASVIAFTNTTTNTNAYSYIGSRIDLGSAGDNAQALVFATNATNALPTEKMRIKSDGTVGIGTASPSWLLTVYAASAPQFALSNATRSFILTNNSGDNLLSFNYGGANRLQFNTTNQWFNTGNLGIGTSSPAALLQVGTATPTAATGGIQFGDDTAARIYRVSSSTIQVSNNLTVGGTLTESSSIRYKENIQTINAPILPKLEAIRPVTYNKKDNPSNTEYGIIAEELNDLFPELVNKNDNGEVESVNYSRLTVLLIKAVKELKQEIEILKNK